MVDHELASGEHFASLVKQNRILFVKVDVAEANASLPKSLKMESRQIELPMYVVIAPGQEQPTVIQERTIAPNQVLEVIDAALNGLN